MKLIRRFLSMFAGYDIASVHVDDEYTCRDECTHADWCPCGVEFADDED